MENGLAPKSKCEDSIYRLKMTDYREEVLEQLKTWQQDMQQKPSLFRKAAKSVQVLINRNFGLINPDTFYYI